MPIAISAEVPHAQGAVMTTLTICRRLARTRAGLATITTITLVSLALTAAFSQAAKASAEKGDLSAYAGKWEGKFHGKTFVTLKLKLFEGRLTGTISKTHIELNQNGELTRAEQGSGEDPIIEARIDGDLLQLTAREHVNNNGEESDENNTLQMKLTDVRTAELRIVAPPDIPAPKAWKIERTASTI
jgi:hypothetical protein